MGHQCAKERHLKRQKQERERAQYDKMMEHWATKHKQTQAKVHKRREMERIHLESITQRVPTAPSKPFESNTVGKKRMGTSELRTPRLPAVVQKLESSDREPSQLRETMNKEWPCPRPSPHYDLKVWNILGELSVEDERIPSPPRSPRV